ncbi:MAG TPA: alpha/beta fold hydrolase [Rhodanobacteraceae bacterium]|nr:alpha/beta fold hydrolase [Rhodanobacteraceae bacterium]
MNGADFHPPRLLKNPHVQSVLASSGVRRMLSLRRGDEIEKRAVEHILDCGEGIRLQGFHTPQRALAEARGLVVLLHGWEGSARSNYVLATGERLLREGFDVFRLNFRDHGETHHLNREIFHSCRIDEVVNAVRDVASRFPSRSLAVAGFSLGGNFALRVALRAPAAAIPLGYALAVCPVISPASGLFGLENGPRFYQRYFLHKWTRSLRAKQALFPDTELFSREELDGDLRGLTRSLVLRHTSFGSLENYLNGYSIEGDRRATLRVPATILTSADDPVIPIEDFRKLKLPANVELDIAAHGGHCAFISDFSLRSFTEDYIAERMLAHAIPDASDAEPTLRGSVAA